MFDSAKVGRVTTLCALVCPEDRLDGVADVINGHENVSHNYVRRDASGRVPYNVWFTLGASSDAGLERVIDGISRELSADIVRLDAKKEYKLDVKFNIWPEP